MTSSWARWRPKSPASRLFAQPSSNRVSRKRSKLPVTGLCEGNPPVTGYGSGSNLPVLARHNVNREHNLSRPSNVYMRRWTRSSLVQITACRQFGAKPLSEPMGLIVNWTLDNNLQWNLDDIRRYQFKKMCLQIPCAKWNSFCLVPNVIISVMYGAVEVQHIINLIFEYRIELVALGIIRDWSRLYKWFRCVRFGFTV